MLSKQCRTSFTLPCFLQALGIFPGQIWHCMGNPGICKPDVERLVQVEIRLSLDSQQDPLGFRSTYSRLGIVERA